MRPSQRTPWRVALFLLVMAIAAGSAQGLAADEKKFAAEKVSKSFAKADRNSDQQLSLEEFLVDRAPAEVAKRDFLLFDLDADDGLSLAEFSTVPTVIEAEYRGPLPDPMQVLVDQGP